MRFAKPGVGCICAVLVYAAENDDTERSVRIAKIHHSYRKRVFALSSSAFVGLTRMFVPCLNGGLNSLCRLALVFARA